MCRQHSNFRSQNKYYTHNCNNHFLFFFSWWAIIHRHHSSTTAPEHFFLVLCSFSLPARTERNSTSRRVHGTLGHLLHFDGPHKSNPVGAKSREYNPQVGGGGGGETKVVRALWALYYSFNPILLKGSFRRTTKNLQLHIISASSLFITIDAFSTRLLFRGRPPDSSRINSLKLFSFLALLYT